jgi:catechol 2,3-dioxygenase-like lactoylglutathione lyase family enzyme
MARVAGLGHVGLYVENLDREREFYVDELGMQVTDELPDKGIVFLSSDPEREHHELLLAQANDIPRDAAAIQQVSFRCDDLADVVDFYDRLSKRSDVEIEMSVTHGNAVGVYFSDPDGIRCEVYWSTGIWAKQPFLSDVDLTVRPLETLRESILEFARAHADTGFVDAHYQSDGYLDLV